MADVGIVYSTGVPTTIGILQLDALLTEGTELKAKATEYAVEEGSPITDHVRLESERLKLSGWITPNDVMNMTADGRPKLIEAKATLRKMMADRQLITVVTGMDTYTDMVIESASIGRDNEGDKLTVDMDLVKIRKATLRTVDMPNATGTAKGKGGSTKTKAGKAPEKPPTKPAEKRVSDLQQVVRQ
jgi:hypothetical protein